jgi:hypothetical protein
MSQFLFTFLMPTLYLLIGGGMLSCGTIPAAFNSSCFAFNFYSKATTSNGTALTAYLAYSTP